MTNIQHFSGITKRLPFEDLDFYELCRITFEMSELGRMKRLLPLHEMEVNFGLVSNRKERRPKLSVLEETTTLCSQKNIRKSIFYPHYANTLRSPVVLLHGLTSEKTEKESTTYIET